MRITIYVPTLREAAGYWKAALLLAVLALTLVWPGLGPNTVKGTGVSLFGDGSDGPIMFSSNTSFVTAVAAANGAATTNTLLATSGSFAAGQKILIHQTRGTGAGVWEINEIQSYVVGNITTTTPLANTYLSTGGASRAQILVVPEYTDVTVNSGVTLSAQPWNGAIGGILAFFANGTVTISGTIRANGVSSSSINGATGGAGFAGGRSVVSGNSYQAEGSAGMGSVVAISNNGNGAGGGHYVGGSEYSSGSGGGNGAAGGQGYYTISVATPSTPGAATSSEDLSTMTHGGGGGGGSGSQTGLGGGTGAGIVFIAGSTVTASGAIAANGGSNGNAPQDPLNGAAVGGGGAGGSILIRGQTIALGTASLTATGGLGAARAGDAGSGNGGVGRIRLEHCAGTSGGIIDPPASVEQISCDGKVPNSINITNVYQDSLPKTCFDVMDSGQTFLFSVCDNDFQGPPASHAACDDGFDTICNDEDPAEGSVTITVDPAVYNVEVGKTPLNITADASTGACTAGPTCALTFTSSSLTKPWFPWDVGTTGQGPPDGVVDLFNDIVSVIDNYCPDLILACAKP